MPSIMVTWLPNVRNIVVNIPPLPSKPAYNTANVLTSKNLAIVAISKACRTAAVRKEGKKEPFEDTIRIYICL